MESPVWWRGFYGIQEQLERRHNPKGNATTTFEAMRQLFLPITSDARGDLFRGLFLAGGKQAIANPRSYWVWPSTVRGNVASQLGYALDQGPSR